MVLMMRRGMWPMVVMRSVDKTKCAECGDMVKSGSCAVVPGSDTIEIFPLSTL